VRVNPSVIWITGLSASGKTTLGQALFNALTAKGIANVEFLDGDIIRSRLDRKYGHSLKERYKVLGKIVEFAQEAVSQGNVAIVATVSHKKDMRKTARKNLSPFMEVFLDCSAQVCAHRDLKGIYEKAIRDPSEYLAGFTEPYERSENPELVLDTAQGTVELCTQQLVKAALRFLRIQP